MQPYRWYDPAEVVEDAEAYVRDIEDRHHGEKSRMYSAMADENHRLRLMAEQALRPAMELAARTPAPAMVFVNTPSPDAIKTVRLGAENALFNLSQTGKPLPNDEALQIFQRFVELLTPAKVV